MQKKNKLNLNPDKMELIMFGLKTVRTKINEFFQLINMYLVISSHLLKQSGTLVLGLTHILPSLLVLLFWLQTLWLEGVLTTVIPCLEVSLSFKSIPT